MILNARLQTEQSAPDATPILLIHGLFGSLDNLGMLARGVRDARPTLQVDVRNHGLSARSDEMNYHVMAQDIVETLDAHQIDRAGVIGHSMGGKIAMALSAIAPERIEKMVMIDIAPVDYQMRRHDEIFAAIRAVTTAGVTRRSEAAEVMRQHIDE
uniref:alpha/beta fold hydrolase n=1 Tax=Pantoea sp. CTOTU49201 TaxID=2953855 RepID=UPI00289FAC4C